MQFARLLQLYRRRGYSIRLQCEWNKAFVWKVAGAAIQFDGALPDHHWGYPDGFDDLSRPDWLTNKAAFNINHPPMPSISGSLPELWDELCGVKLSASEFISDRARREAAAFVANLPHPIVCLHASGSNWRHLKSMPPELSFEVIQRLLKLTGGSVVSLDWDSRDPVVASWRCKSILTNWGRIDPERLCALYEICDLLIGIDSGPLHLAAFTDIPTLGVFTGVRASEVTLHPVRCCLPNPNAAYIVPDRFEREWDRPDRLLHWDFWQYPGDGPDADFIASAAMDVLSQRGFVEAKPAIVDPTKKRSAAMLYSLEFIGEFETQIRLHDNGQVSGCEQFDTWELDSADQIHLIRGSETVVVMKRQHDGGYRGKAASGERLVQAEMFEATSQPFRSVEPVESVDRRPNEYRYTTMEEFKTACFEFARRLPPVRAVAGVPRSGLLAASLIALELNCPIIPIESLLDEQIPDLPIPRRGRGPRYIDGGMILVVDDSCSSGRSIQALRPRLHPDVKIAVIDGNETADFYFRENDRGVWQSYEWTLFHDDNAEYTLTDMDGVLCDDWSGGVEDHNYDSYLDFLNNVAPRRIPSYPLLGIVTNRLERHRKETERWLERHGVKYQHLIMSPHEDFVRRDHENDAAARKAKIYLHFEDARLFVESCGIQARAIQATTQRPVLSIQDNAIIGPLDQFALCVPQCVQQ